MTFLHGIDPNSWCMWWNRRAYRCLQVVSCLRFLYNDTRYIWNENDNFYDWQSKNFGQLTSALFEDNVSAEQGHGCIQEWALSIPARNSQVCTYTLRLASQNVIPVLSRIKLLVELGADTGWKQWHMNQLLSFFMQSVGVPCMLSHPWVSGVRPWCVRSRLC